MYGEILSAIFGAVILYCLNNNQQEQQRQQQHTRQHYQRRETKPHESIIIPNKSSNKVFRMHLRRELLTIHYAIYTLVHKLFLELKNNKPSNNYICSPYSILSIIVSVFHATTTQMIIYKNICSELGIKGIDLDVFSKIFQLLNQNKNIQMVNKTYIQERLLKFVLPDFNEKIKNYSPISPITNASEMNNFIAKSTNNNIKKFFSESIIKDSVIILLNIIYFKANWKYAFDTTDTKYKKFTHSDNTTGKVNMMYKKFKRNTVKYLEINNDQAVMLPYENDKLFLTVFCRPMICRIIT
jgi:serine protease inhibitor